MLEDGWLPLLLAWLRVLPLGWALASATGGLVPQAVALSLTLAVALPLAPLSGPIAAPSDPAAWLLVVLRELCIGGVFALALSLSLLAIAWSVRMSQAHDSRNAVAPLARAYALCAGYLVLALGGLRALVLGLGESFRDAPAGVPVLNASAFALGAAQLVADALASALGFALPLVLGAWLLEASSALLGRVLLPGASSQASPLRPALFLLLCALLLVPIASRAPETVRGAITSARALTRALAR